MPQLGEVAMRTPDAVPVKVKHPAGGVIFSSPSYSVPTSDSPSAEKVPVRPEVAVPPRVGHPNVASA